MRPNSLMSTTISVPASQSTWTAGPTNVTNKQTLLIEASGSVVWAPDPFYSEVEGPYPPDYTANHVFDIGNIGGGLRLAILVVDAGSTPPLLLGGSRTQWLDPRWTLESDGVTRRAFFFPSDLSNKTRTNGPWDIYLGFADANYADNSGSFTVVSTITQVDGQNPGLIGLPGAMTQADYDNAGICSITGLLTPANRLRRVDGRDMCDIVAPHHNPGPKDGW
jgi:hypothetical protein